MDQKRKCSRRENEEPPPPPPPPPPLPLSSSAAPPSSAGTPSSSFSKTVSLDDWGLIKSDIDYNSKRLAVDDKEVEGLSRFCGGAQRNGDNESTRNSAGYSVEVASDGLSSSIRSLLRENYRRKLGGYTPCRHRAERIRVQTLADSEPLAVRKVTNINEADSLPDMTDIVLETAVKSPLNVKERNVKSKKKASQGDQNLSRAHGKKMHVSNSMPLEKKDSGCDTKPISAETNVPFEKLPDIDTRKVCKAPKKKASQGDQNLSNGKTQHEFQSPLTRGKTRKLSITSPELLNLKRSSSGRVLVPPMDKWRQQGIVYDMDGSVVAIVGIDTLNPPCKGSKSEPPKKRKLNKQTLK